jgi:hypothetical protein
VTTVAACAKSGVMAADSRWSDGDESGPMRKVWRVAGALYGFAGEVKHFEPWLDALRLGRTPPRVHPLTVLRLDAQGLATWDSTDGWVACVSPFAVGSGGKAARVAMKLGHSPTAAVRATCDIDAGTGGPVRTYKLKGS